MVLGKIVNWWGVGGGGAEKETVRKQYARKNQKLLRTKHPNAWTPDRQKASWASHVQILHLKKDASGKRKGGGRILTTVFKDSEGENGKSGNQGKKKGKRLNSGTTKQRDRGIS